MGENRAAGRVLSGQTFGQQSRVVSGQRFVGSGRVQEKWPMDNSARALRDSWKVPYVGFYSE